MSVYIQGMEMPKTESEVLIIAIESNGSVYPVRIDGDGQPMIFPNEEMKNCAIPVQPHGRLIDADKLDDVCVRLNSEDWGITVGEHKLLDRVLFEFPTVLPAEQLEKE